jgi:hypothetical protein
MQKIFLVMKRKPLAEKIKSCAGASRVYECDYDTAEDSIRLHGADAVLIEIAEAGEYGVGYCLALCTRLKTYNRKLLALCSEQDERCVYAVIKAKRQGVIDDFIFYDAPVEYIVSKLLH